MQTLKEKISDIENKILELSKLKEMLIAENKKQYFVCENTNKEIFVEENRKDFYERNIEEELSKIYEIDNRIKIIEKIINNKKGFIVEEYFLVCSKIDKIFENAILKTDKNDLEKNRNVEHEKTYINLCHINRKKLI